MALSMLGVVHIPVYPTLSKNDYAYIVNHSDAKVVIIGNRSIYKKVQPAFETFEKHPLIYTLDQIDGEEVLYNVFKQENSVFLRLIYIYCKLLRNIRYVFIKYG